MAYSIAYSQPFCGATKVRIVAMDAEDAPLTVATFVAHKGKKTYTFDMPEQAQTDKPWYAIVAYGDTDIYSTSAAGGEKSLKVSLSRYAGTTAEAIAAFFLLLFFILLIVGITYMVFSRALPSKRGAAPASAAALEIKV